MGGRVGWRPGAVTRSDRGMATVELALAIPVLVGVAAMLLWALGLGTSQVLVVGAAREAARAAARGETLEAVNRQVDRLLPGARTTVARSGSEVLVTVLLDREPTLGVLRPLGRRLTATAAAWREAP
jgi:Flp pilus assembly protein TadG